MTGLKMIINMIMFITLKMSHLQEFYFFKYRLFSANQLIDQLGLLSHVELFLMRLIH